MMTQGITFDEFLTKAAKSSSTMVENLIKKYKKVNRNNGYNKRNTLCQMNMYSQFFQIDIDKLAESGVKGIVTDLDNTLVGWDVADPTEAVKTWFEEARQKGLQLQLCLTIMKKSR